MWHKVLHKLWKTLGIRIQGIVSHALRKSKEAFAPIKHTTDAWRAGWRAGGNAEWLGNQLQHESPPGQKAIINLHLATLMFPAQLHARDSFVISAETSLGVSSHARLSWDSTLRPHSWSQLSDQFPFPASLLDPSSLSSHSPQHLSRLF